MLITLLAICSAQETIEVNYIPQTGMPPPKRMYSQMQYSSITNQAVIFGGYKDINTVYNDIWSFDFNTNRYSRIYPTNQFAPSNKYSGSRVNSGSFIDNDSNRFYVFGGNSQRGPQNDLWSMGLSNKEWRRESPTGKIPTSRYRFGYTSYYNETNSLKFLIYGGNSVEGLLNETYM